VIFIAGSHATACTLTNIDQIEEFSMIPIFRRVTTIVLLTLASTGWWAAGALAGENPYPVPEGGVPELIALIQQISQVRPETPQDDIRHRRFVRPAMRQAAEKILELEQDSSSEAYQAARFLVMVERIRATAQCHPDPQQTITDAQAYIAELVEAGQHRVAADLALLLGRTLVHAGEWQHAVDAYKKLLPLFADTKSPAIVSQLQSLSESVLEILERMQQNGPAAEKPVIQPSGRLVPLDLTGARNRKTVDFSGSGDFEGNGLAELPTGEQVLRGVTFRIGEGVVQLGSTNLADESAEASDIAVQRKIIRLYALHATQWNTDDGALVGQYRFKYQDGETVLLPIVYGADIRDWWVWDDGAPLTRGVVAWTGANLHTERYGIALRLCLSVWDNPHPEKQVMSLDFVSSMDTQAAPFCVALTVEEPETP
jgi:hypothetical protein